MQNLTFYPNLLDTGEYLRLQPRHVTKINMWFGWTNQFGDIYVSNPPIGSKNDIIFTTGLNSPSLHD